MYGGEQYSAEPKASWDSNIDPSLLNVSMGQYHEMDHSMQVQKFLGQPERTWCNIPSLPMQTHLEFNKPYEVQAPFPYANDYPGDSPSSTESSSAQSPQPESEPFQMDNYYQSQSFEASSPLSRSMSHLSHRPQDIWPGTLPQATAAQLPGLVSLSDLQGQPDPQEVTYNDDEGYSHMYDKALAAEVETARKLERQSRHYRHKSDSAIGQSIKGEDDNESTIVVMNSSTDDEVDADAEAEDEDTIEVAAPSDEEEASDQEYSPSTRTSKRKRTTRSLHTSPISTPSKRQKASNSTKPSSTTTKGGKNKCPSCAHTSKDAATLTKHIAAQHTRPYVCTFAFAGCSSTFGNKNEWKRHVASQHLGLRVWVCTKDACANKRASSYSSFFSHGEAGAVFNRKDLFTQHLRRMHAPFKVKRQGKTDAKWEIEVKELQNNSERAVRLPPTKTCCPVTGCDNVFEGHNGWDERMEHVGRHLEGEKEKGGEKVEVREEEDHELINWAVGEGIIESSPAGWIFSMGGGKVEEDLDAEGEDE